MKSEEEKKRARIYRLWKKANKYNKELFETAISSASDLEKSNLAGAYREIDEWLCAIVYSYGI